MSVAGTVWGKITFEDTKWNLDDPFTDSESLRALELRQFDKQAKEFIKKLKQKANNQA